MTFLAGLVVAAAIVVLVVVIGISQLQHMNATRLRDLTRPRVVFNHNEPVAVLVPYALYIQWQELPKVADSEGSAP